MYMCKLQTPNLRNPNLNCTVIEPGILLVLSQSLHQHLHDLCRGLTLAWLHCFAEQYQRHQLELRLLGEFKNIFFVREGWTEGEKSEVTNYGYVMPRGCGFFNFGTHTGFFG